MKSSTQFYAPRNEVTLLLLETGERFSFQLCASSDPGLPPKLSSLPPYTIDFFNFIENEAVDAVVQSGSRYSTLYDVYRNLKDVLICSIGSIKNGVLMESQLFTRTGAGRRPFKLVQAKLKRKMRRDAWVAGPRCWEYYSKQLYSIDAERMFERGVRLNSKL